ncbi:MAG TPA: glycosyltransferase family 39 protein, partial [Candidatus Nitrosocosmicus sp.]|nr:glycosyltransferase family 39 protein [Candidatus Nitrosocosmicus sp.]
MNKFLKSYWPLLIILAITSFLFLLRLDRDPLTDWDECVYAQQSVEMKQTGNFLTNQWNKALVFEKPPLYNWIIQIPYLFKVNEFSARFPMVILSLLLITYVYLFAKKYFNERTAIYASLILLSTQLFVTYSIHVNTDIGFTLFVFLGFYYWIAARNNNNLSIVSGIFFGLAVLTKGLGVIPYLAALGITLLFNFNKQIIINYIKMAISFLVVIMPWHAYHYFKYGNDFIQVYIIEHIIKRSNIAIDFHFEGRLFYFKLIYK